MGQYYKPTSVDKMESLYSHDYGSMSKLMEHSYIGNDFVSIAENLLSPEGRWYKHGFVWAGDYADKEPSGDNLYFLAENIRLKGDDFYNRKSFRYIVNHTKKEFVESGMMSRRVGSYLDDCTNIHSEDDLLNAELNIKNKK